MHEDISHKGKTYRIITEKANKSHPEGAVVTLVELTDPGHKTIFAEPCTESDCESMVETLRLYIDGI